MASCMVSKKYFVQPGGICVMQKNLIRGFQKHVKFFETSE